MAQDRIYYRDEDITVRNMRPSDPEVIAAEEAAQGWLDATADKYFMRLQHEAQGRAIPLVAEYRGQVAGYVNVYPDPKADWGPLGGQGYPQIMDFGVLEKFRRLGIGTRLMDAAEEIAGQFRDTVYLGVGLNANYGPAQRLYILRGYVPDGSGVWYHNQVCPAYASCCNDDELALYLVKKLR